MVCTQGAKFHEVRDQGVGETHESQGKPLTKEGLAKLDQLILKEWKIDKNDARRGTSVRVI